MSHSRMDRRDRRSAKPCSPGQSHPAVRPDDGRKRPGLSRRPWGKTGLRGVYRTPTGRFAVKITAGCEKVHVGIYDTEEQAARAFDAAALELRGPGAALNYPPAPC